MEQFDGRKAKVTEETKEESRNLKQLWDAVGHPPQAEFGEKYGIGNQSAVGQFLRGEVPLSLKAARGFASGLGILIEDFSPRLAGQAAAIANLVPGEPLKPDVARVAAAINALSEAQMSFVLDVVTTTIDHAKRNLGGASERSSERMRKAG